MADVADFQGNGTGIVKFHGGDLKMLLKINNLCENHKALSNESLTVGHV
jgi:hypothetical protein